MVSYNSNVEMLLQLYAKSARSADLHLMWKVTFDGRKYEIRKGLLKNAEEVLKKCPMLSQPDYVSFYFIVPTIISIKSNSFFLNIISLAVLRARPTFGKKFLCRV